MLCWIGLVARIQHQQQQLPMCVCLCLYVIIYGGIAFIEIIIRVQCIHTVERKRAPLHRYKPNHNFTIISLGNGAYGHHHQHRMHLKWATYKSKFLTNTDFQPAQSSWYLWELTAIYVAAAATHQANITGLCPISGNICITFWHNFVCSFLWYSIILCYAFFPVVVYTKVFSFDQFIN